MSALIKRWFYVILIIPRLCGGQVADNFSDGNFSANPQWDGDGGKFTINSSLQLQLDDDDAGRACLFTPIMLFEAMEWRCWVRQSFSPSGNNNARIYLLALNSCDDELPDGIFLQLGEGGSADAIRLMEQADGDTSTLIMGSPGAIASSFRCSIKTVFKDGEWYLFADYSGEEDYISEGNATGSMIAGSAYLGVVCNYTISNSTKFYFDNFYAGSIQYDTIPPQALQVYVTAPDKLEVYFSENIDPESAEDYTNYHLSHGLGFPVEVLVKETNWSVAELFFADTLVYGEIMELSIQNIRDISGNDGLPALLDLAWYYPGRYDVVINEIMADPTPPQMLPDYEYLELFNTTHLPLNLSGWSLTVGEAEKPLTSLNIAPQGYIIVGKDEAESSFSNYGPYYGLESFSLVNTGQSIVLANENGEMIHGLNYTGNWYGDDDKSEGGWSLEQLNPYNPCISSENWRASLDFEGGTPGEENSVFDDIFMAPEIVNACLLDSVRVRVEFNQAIHQDITLFPDYFIIDRGIGKPLAILPDDPFFTSFILYPEKPLLQGIIYELSCNTYISNCMGDSVYVSQNVRLGLPESPLWQDLVINEILFNPFPGGGDYVELYNRSKKAINLTGLVLASVRESPPSPPDTSFAYINTACKVLMPGDYAVLSKDFDKVSNYYYCQDIKSFLEPESFPSYSNEEGTVILFDHKLNVLDVFSYHEDMHYPLLNSVEGVSLERIHYDRVSIHATSWHSASQLSGFGTPGYKNSQFSEIGIDDERISITPRVFTPGCDGLDDYTNIKYNLEKGGCLASVLIFNAAGQMVRHLVNNELLGTSGSYSWDGLTDDNQRAVAGIYVVLLELIDLSGNVIRYKKTVIIAPAG